jgi:hypothetical protein
MYLHCISTAPPIISDYLQSLSNHQPSNRLTIPNLQPPVRSYLSSCHKLHKLNELYEPNELYLQSLVRRYPSTDGRQLAASNLSNVSLPISTNLYESLISLMYL